MDASGVFVSIHKVGWWNVRGAALRAFEGAARDRRCLADTWLVLEHVVRLSWWHARNTDRHAAYACCSEAWLAERVGCRRETVSDHVSRLSDLGLLEVVHRRKVDGQWQTNLYCLGAKIWVVLRGLVRMAARSATDKTQLDHSRSERYVCADGHTVPKGMGDLLKLWFTRGQAGGGERHG